MLPAFSLAYLTASSLTPPQAIDLAAELGYQSVGLRLYPAAPGGAAQRLHKDPHMLAETVARVKDTGVGVFDLEIVRIGAVFDAGEYLSFFEVGATLGAKAVLVAGDDIDEARLAVNYAKLCEFCRPFGLTADLEFMPWTAVPNAASAVRVLNAAGNPANAGVLVDALHFGRSATTLDDIKALPREWLHYAQICDAPAVTGSSDDELIVTARRERLLPGEGVIDLRGLFDQLPRELPVSIEIPGESRVATMGVRAWAKQALECSHALFAQRDAA